MRRVVHVRAEFSAPALPYFIGFQRCSFSNARSRDKRISLVAQRPAPAPRPARPERRTIWTMPQAPRDRTSPRPLTLYLPTPLRPKSRPFTTLSTALRQWRSSPEFSADLKTVILAIIAVLLMNYFRTTRLPSPGLTSSSLYLHRMTCRRCRLGSVHEFEARAQDGNIVDLSSYAGKALLIVPIPVDAEPGDLATLEALHQKYQARGLVILGFPTPEFRFKPIEPDQIQEKAHALRAEFPLFAPVRVNGRNAHPLFVFLKAKLPGYLGTKIQYHGTKFLIDRYGRPIRRIGPLSSVAEDDILTALVDT